MEMPLINRVRERWGLSVADLARATGANPATTRAWVSGYDQGVPQECHERLEELRSFLTRADEYGEDPVAWLEDPLVDGHLVTGWDLYEDGEAEALLDIISGEDPAEVLDDTVRDWRTRYVKIYDRFETETDEQLAGSRYR